MPNREPSYCEVIKFEFPSDSSHAMHHRSLAMWLKARGQAEVRRALSELVTGSRRLSTDESVQPHPPKEPLTQHQLALRERIAQCACAHGLPEDLTVALTSPGPDTNPLATVPDDGTGTLQSATPHSLITDGATLAA